MRRAQFQFKRSSGQALVWVVLLGAVILIGGLTRIADFYRRNRVSANKEARESRNEMADAFEASAFEVASQIAFALGSGALTCNQVATDVASRWPRVFREVKWTLWDGQGITSTDLRHQDAFRRCQTQQYLNPTDNYANRNSIYFCLKLSPTAVGERTIAMLYDGPVVMEVAIALKDLFTGALVQCSNFRTMAPGVRGATLSFATYWSRQNGKERNYFTNVEQRDFLTN